MAAGFANTEARARGCACAARSPVRCRRALAVPISAKLPVSKVPHVFLACQSFPVHPNSATRCAQRASLAAP